MAKTTWGRKETIIWPQHRPIYTYGAIFVAIVLTLLFLYGRLRFIGTPLQRFYMPVYVRTSIFGSFSKTHRSQYRMLFLTGRGNKPSPAMNDDVVHGKAVEPGGRIIPLALSPSALRHGDDLLFRGPLRSYVDARLNDYLKVALYKDELSAIVKVPLLCGAGIFLILLPLAVTKDVKRQKALKYGRRLKGPEKLTPQEFNEVVKGDGVGFKTDDMKEMIRIPARAEAQHMQFIGDTGAGKSALMFQVLRQVQSRGDSAIVYDPAREFVKRFYDPSRGDVILNPLDKRCPYWGPAEELRSRSEAKALAVSLFQPPQDRKGEFFIESPQKIFAFLMAYGPTPDELVQWMSNPDEIDRRLKGTEAVAFARDKGFEREAVVDERALYVDALRRGMGEMTYPEIRASFEARVASGEFKQITDDGSKAGRRFTTAATIKAENEIVQKVKDGQGRAPQIMAIEGAVPLVDSRPHFNAAQKRVVEEVLTSYDRVQGLQGRAGSGKTSVLETIRDGAERNGYAVEGFAPTSRAAKQLRDARIKADTLQRFLAGGGLQAAGDPANKHLYMVDESSLASTQQMRDFLNKIAPQDKVLLIGDTRQHQGVDAGKPFEQLQEAGMRTAQLDQIMRQKDVGLLKAVEHLSNNETALGVEMLSQQGRITEIAAPERRVAVIAKEYAAHPENTLIVSPDNASRRDINQAVRQELKALGVVDGKDHSMSVLTPRNDMTGADREWAASYQPGDVLHYVRGSKEHGIEARTYAQVVTTNAPENLVTVRREDGQQVTYDPSRLHGIAAYREIEREFATGDKIQFTAPQRDLQVANRDLGTIQSIADDGKISVRMDGAKDRIVRFDPNEMRHFDHGYAVTSHSSQGLTSERVLVNMDTEVHPELINSRFAYVSVSRASHDAQIFTNDAALLAGKLSQDVSKSAAVSFGNAQSNPTAQGLSLALSR